MDEPTDWRTLTATATVSSVGSATKFGFGDIEDDRYIAAIGMVAIEHPRLDHVLRLTEKSLTGRGLKDVQKRTVRCSSAKLRKRVRRFGRLVLGDGAEFRRLQSLLDRAAALSSKRNQLMHDALGVNEDGELVVLKRGRKLIPAQDPIEVRDLARSIRALIIELDSGRLCRFDELHRE